MRRLISGGRLNSPWGMAIAPEHFGDFGKALLVGNFGDGTITAFNPTTGESLGTLQDAAGKPIVNPGLWALQFGNGVAGGDADALYFTAGISGPAEDAIESHGLFGSIQAAPIVSTDGVVNAAGFQTAIAANTWVSIFRKNLSATTRSWAAADFVDNRLPTTLDNVSVKIDGKPAYVSYISPTQLNVLTPAGLPPGEVAVEVTSNGLTGAATTAQSQAVSPAFFQTGKYAIATHADSTNLVGPPDLLPGSSSPAKAREIVVPYGAGFGPTDPGVPEGVVVASPAALTNPVTITVGGANAEILVQALTTTGLNQFNIRIPAGAAAGDVPIVAQSAGLQSRGGVFTAIEPAPPAPDLAAAAQIENFRFAPDHVAVPAGGKVTWTKRDNVQHTIFADAGEFASKVLGRDSTFEVTFRQPGIHSYHCSIHPFMTGQVVVK